MNFNKLDTQKYTINDFNEAIRQADSNVLTEEDKGKVISLFYDAAKTDNDNDDEIYTIDKQGWNKLINQALDLLSQLAKNNVTKLINAKMVEVLNAIQSPEEKLEKYIDDYDFKGGNTNSIKELFHYIESNGGQEISIIRSYGGIQPSISIEYEINGKVYKKDISVEENLNDMDRKNNFSEIKSVAEEWLNNQSSDYTARLEELGCERVLFNGGKESTIAFVYKMPGDSSRKYVIDGNGKVEESPRTIFGKFNIDW